MSRLLRGVEQTLNLLGALLVFIILAAVCAQIYMRYVVDDATTWSDTVAACALVWMTFLTATAAVRRDENLVVRFLWARLGPESRKLVATGCHLVVLLFSLVLTYSGVMLMAITRNAEVEGLVLEVTWAQFYSVSVISGALMVLFSLEHIALLWFGGKQR